MIKNSLSSKNPELAKQWHPTKNGDLNPSLVTVSSGRKVWWKCPKGEDHEWEAIIANRNKGIGCPICSNQKLVRSNSLASINPKLASEWHPTKNGNLTPYDVLPSVKRKVWWKCPKGEDHEWQASVNNRSFGRGCPICSGHKVVESNSLEKLYPEIAKQWHPTKNGNLSPSDVTAGNSKYVWWKCPKGDDHEWQATINHRTSGTGCPKCNPAFSVPELRIFCELKAIFPTLQHRAIIKKNEVDIFIPEIGIGIEYDGVYWHHDKREKDLEKNRVLSDVIQLIRVREADLELFGPNDISTGKREINVGLVKDILKVILKISDNLRAQTIAKIDQYMRVKNWVATDLFDELFSRRKHVAFEKSLNYLFPKLASEWHPQKNGALLPEFFTPGSGRNVWWKGRCRHVWRDSINHRSSGRDCPKCRYSKASITRRKNAEDQFGSQQVMGFIINKKRRTR